MILWYRSATRWIHNSRDQAQTAECSRPRDRAEVSTSEDNKMTYSWPDTKCLNKQNRVESKIRKKF